MFCKIFTRNIQIKIMKIISGVIFFLLILFFSSEGYSQGKARKNNNLRISQYRGNIKSFSNKRYLSIGSGINTLNYFGDLAPKSSIGSTDISFTRPGISAFAEYKYASRISFRANLEWGTLRADDFESADPADDLAKYRYIRNLHFRNQIIELSVVGKVDLFTNRGTYLSRPLFNPYVFGGLGVFFHNPKAIAPELDQVGLPLDEAGQWVALQPLGTEGQYSDSYNVKPYSKIQISLPVGIGLTYRLMDNLDFGFEIGYRVLFFDYIDDVSNIYVDLGALDSPLAKAMSDRSQEPIAAVAGTPREFENVIFPNTGSYTYTSTYDGIAYTVFRGYGHEAPTNNRGNASDNDIFFVTSLKISYILGGTFRNAKFR